MPIPISYSLILQASGGINGDGEEVDALVVADMSRLKLKETVGPDECSKGDFRCQICGSHAVKHVISDVDNIHVVTRGFTNDGIPEIENTVRIDLVGGFALQRVTESRSYFSK